MADTSTIDATVDSVFENGDSNKGVSAEVNSPSHETETGDVAAPENAQDICDNENDNCPVDNPQESCKNNETGTGNDEDIVAEADLENFKKSSNKRVAFPEDSNIVRGYLDPPDPWKNVPDWRTEDLVKSYKRGCEKHGTKPLNKVLQQLQCIENIGERYEILSLKGERLDLRQCESLEEIFKHVRFRCIDFEATHLDDEMAVALFEMVEYYESACKLNISFNKGIGPRGWMSCSRLVRRTPGLTFIDARNCDLNERVIPILGRALRMGCFLQRLHLQNSGLAGRALIILVAALKMNETLKELFLGDNKFMPTDGVQIGNLLKYNSKLELLDLRNNHLQDAGIGHICDGLAEQILDTGLLTLVLWNNQITFQGMSAINKALTSAVNLETLNLGHNPVTNEGIHILKDGLLKTKGLLKLGLSGTKVTCEGAVALAEVIADNTRLVRVDLQENEIKTAGMMALSLALRVNESLTRLDLDRETKKESGIKDYADQQRRLLREINSFLERNREISHRREEEKREIEEKNKENARKLQEAAGENETEEVIPEYIPSRDTVHRPKLLFLPLTTGCPEAELDSPVRGETFHIEASSPMQALHLSPPASSAADLLSPQYCQNPKATAKKIFSVTKVTTPIQAAVSAGFPHPVVSSVINSPTKVHSPLGQVVDSVIPHLVPPLPDVSCPSLMSPDPLLASMNVQPLQVETTASPTTLQKVIEEQTLVSYIRQIVENSEAVNNVVRNSEAETEVEPACIHSTLEQHETLNPLVSCYNNNSSASNIGTLQNALPNSAHSLPEKSGQDVETKKEKARLNHSDVSAMENEVKEIELPAKTETEMSNQKTHCDTDENIDREPNSSAYCDTVNNSDNPVSGGKETVEKWHQDTDKEEVVDTDKKNDIEMAVLKASNIVSSQNGSSAVPESSPVSARELSDPNSLSELDMPSLSEDIVNTEPGSGELLDDFFDCDDDKDRAMDELQGEFVDCLKTENGDSSEVKDNSDGQVFKDDTEKDSGDLEPWNTVNKSELDENSTAEPLNTQNSTKPDFHTNLSFNGLRRELASLIDEENPGSQASVSYEDIVKNGVTFTQNGADDTDDWADSTDVFS